MTPHPHTALAAVASGHGPPVVLVHGALGDYRQWANISHELESRYRVIAISRRYHWPNAAPQRGDPYTYEGHSVDLASHIRSLSPPVHLVGHSWGAGVALLTALGDASIVRSLVLIEPAFGSLLETAGPELSAEMTSREALIAAMRQLAGAGAHEAASRGLIDWLQDSRHGFASLSESVRHALLENAATVGPTFSTPAPHVSCERLQALEVPALVLHGIRTRLFFRRIAERVTSCLPAASLAVVPDAGHMSIVENPAAIAALLIDFFGRN